MNKSGRNKYHDISANSQMNQAAMKTNSEVASIDDEIFGSQ